MSLPKPIGKRQPLHMSLDVLKEDFEDVIGYKFGNLVVEDLAYSIEYNIKQEPDTFQSTSPIWEVDLIDFNTPDWRDFLATDPICQ
jgi:hypothetical protein